MQFLIDWVTYLFFFPESSKELEELRAAFSRSLDYMKQDVEESGSTLLHLLWPPSRFGFHVTLLCNCRVWWKWRSLLCHYADLGKDRGKQWPWRLLSKADLIKSIHLGSEFLSCSFFIFLFLNIFHNLAPHTHHLKASLNHSNISWNAVVDVKGWYTVLRVTF